MLSRDFEMQLNVHYFTNIYLWKSIWDNNNDWLQTGALKQCIEKKIKKENELIQISDFY